MKAFEYAAPQSEEAAVQLLAEAGPQAEVLAGGTDLVGLMKAMIVRPQRVVNIMEIDSLKAIDRSEDGGVRIGAAVSLEQLIDSSDLNDYAAVRQAAQGVNSMQLQCQGTLGGDLCQRPRCWYFRSGHDLLGPQAEQGDNSLHAVLGNHGPAKFVSASRIAPALIAWGAKLRIVGPEPGQERLLDAADLFRVPRHSSQRETVLEPGQLLTHVLLPPADGRLSASYEVKHGCGPEAPLAAAAVSFSHSGGIVREASVVLGHVAPTPWPSPEAARSLVQLTIAPDTAERAGEIALANATPLSHNEYKVQLAKVAVKRAVLRAAGLDTGGF